jgi:Subtilase family
MGPQQPPWARPRRCSAVTGGYLRGSGANQAAAVISGAAAAVLRQHPTRTNTQVKALLTCTTTKVGSQADTASGQGTLTLSMNQGRLEG